VHVHGYLALLKAFRGHLRDAAAEADRALDVAQRAGWLFLPQSAMAFLARAVVHLLRAEPAQCSVATGRGRSCLGDQRDRFTETGLALVRARLDVSLGDVHAARSTLAALERDTAGWVLPPFLERWSTVVEAEVLLGEGDPSSALAVLRAEDDAGGSQRTGARRAVLAARACLEANRVQECLDTLVPLQQAAPADLVPATEVWLLAALAHDRMGHDADARTALGRALDIAAPDGIARPFLLAGERCRSLLERQQQAGRGPRRFVALLLRTLSEHDVFSEGPGPVEPLTDRERSVLMLLPTMMSNAEIADELFVSVNTVKVHLKSLYRKLGVSNRREAAARARALEASGPRDLAVPV
jgi:LuxR family maltose regulon positive regulatory protein